MSKVFLLLSSVREVASSELIYRCVVKGAIVKDEKEAKDSKRKTKQIKKVV